MSNSIKIIIAFLATALLFGCQTRLDEQPRSNLKYHDLPDTIKSIYLDAIKPRIVVENGDTTLISYDRDRKLVCLDTDIKKYSWETTFIITFVDKIIFKFDDKTVYMPFNGNTINPPYILYHRQFYFVYTRDAFVGANGVKSAVYGVFDLRQVLNPERVSVIYKD